MPLRASIHVSLTLPPGGITVSLHLNADRVRPRSTCHLGDHLWCKSRRGFFATYGFWPKPLLGLPKPESQLSSGLSSALSILWSPFRLSEEALPLRVRVPRLKGTQSKEHDSSNRHPNLRISGWERASYLSFCSRGLTFVLQVVNRKWDSFECG